MARTDKPRWCGRHASAPCSFMASRSCRRRIVGSSLFFMRFPALQWISVSDKQRAAVYAVLYSRRTRLW